MEKPRVTEIQVRMDCNGCVQKIKKALHGINGIYDLYVDFPQQKITIIGWVDPQKIAKAIKKTRKTAIICSHSEVEPSDDQPPAQPSEPGPPPAPESTNQPTAEAGPQAEAPKESPLPENPPSEAANSTPTNQPPLQSSKPKDIEEIHVIHHHAPDRYGPYGYEGQWNPRGSAPGLIRVEQSQPTYVNHSYNANKPSPRLTEYAYINEPSPPSYSQYYNRPADQYTYSTEENSDGNITSIFSDENPNACRIV